MKIRDLWERLHDNPQVGIFLRDNQDLLKKIGIIIVIAVLMMISFVAKSHEAEPAATIEEPVVAQQEGTAKVFVDIGGAVNNPMVVELDDGSRVDDAIEAAGGLAKDADLADINRAALVNDGDKIYIPQKIDDMGMNEDSGSSGVSSYVANDGKVNINTADSEQLQTLTGVGPATAEKIIDYRQTNGRFTVIEDLMKVSGIGEKTYEKLKDSIKV